MRLPFFVNGRFYRFDTVSPSVGPVIEKYLLAPVHEGELPRLGTAVFEMRKYYHVYPPRPRNSLHTDEYGMFFDDPSVCVTSRNPQGIPKLVPVTHPDALADAEEYEAARAYYRNILVQIESNYQRFQDENGMQKDTQCRLPAGVQV